MELSNMAVRMVLWILLLTTIAQVSATPDATKEIKLERTKRSACNAKFSHISDHSACLSASADASNAGISAADKTAILAAHNAYRRDVSPSASDMLKLSWDDEVASIAQKWAENCVLGHDSNYKRYIPGRFSVGQNLAMGHSSWTAAIDAWHNEVNDFNHGGSNSLSSVGHYTQMVWARTSSLGCGYALCTSTRYYVCNYAPAGNLDINNPYTSGSSCGQCASQCSESSLCDCTSTVCLNRATIDLNACTCGCNSKPYLVGTNCALNCTGLDTDPTGCGSGSFISSNCPIYSNLPSDCPLMCQTCPDGDSTGTSTEAGGKGTTVRTPVALLLGAIFVVMVV